ncbi:hypothetical protein V1264_000161 [Littorina saxatilis]|uniref:GDP-fucose pyrophosphorylase domain-containing protein n=2 Tax=Littorina saxatilis TaxID=31220 RepID=A0AAN9GME8_9CAEN
MEKVKWTAVVLTCSNKNWAHTLQNELEARQAKGKIDKDVILLTVEDPKTNVGSGGATINALLTVVEHISARKGYTVINPDVLNDVHILILHHGTSYSYDACGRPFTTLPAKFSSSASDDLVCNVDLIFRLITEKIAAGSAPGVWVSSLDMLLAIPAGADLTWKPCDACLVTMPAKVQYGKDHGVCKMDTQSMVENILYQKGDEALQSCKRQDGTVPVICGIVYLSTAVAEKLLSFYTKPPLDACTYFGLDSGMPPLKLSLFFDVLLPMTTVVSETDFVQGERSTTYGKPAAGAGDSRDNMAIARKMLWKELHGYRLRAFMVEGGEVHYLTNLASEHKKMLLCSPVAMERDGLTWTNMVQADVKPEVQLGENIAVINSVLKGDITVGNKTVICHSCLSGNMVVGKDSFISGISIEHPKPKKRMQFADSMVVQGFSVCLKTLGTTRNVLTVHGRFDNIKAPAWKSNVTFCNEPWLVFLNRTGILNEDLWGTDVGSDDQTVSNAKLFPVFHATENVGMKEILWLQGQLTDTPSLDLLKRWRASWRLSLAEILTFVDLQAELNWRK